jgi:hypothetical protein
MQVSPRLLEVASRVSGQSAETLKSQVKFSEHLDTSAEQDFADLMADRSQVVAYEVTDPLRSIVRLNPRHSAALSNLYKHSDESRAQGFTLAREIEAPGGPRGAYTVFDDGNGLVELCYKDGGQYTTVFVDTTPNQQGEQYLVADITPAIREALSAWAPHTK